MQNIMSGPYKLLREQSSRIDRAGVRTPKDLPSVGADRPVPPGSADICLELPALGSAMNK
jgi:hypothetical protein